MVNIACREMIPAVSTAVIWGQRWKGSYVLFKCNNMAVVLLLNNCLVKDLHLTYLVRCLFFFAVFHQFTFVAEDISGAWNWVAYAVIHDRPDLFYSYLHSCLLLLHMQLLFLPLPQPTARSTYQMNLALLKEAICRLYGAGLSKNTSQTYTSGKRRFISFCSHHSIPLIPISENVLWL